MAESSCLQEICKASLYKSEAWCLKESERVFMQRRDPW